MASRDGRRRTIVSRTPRPRHDRCPRPSMPSAGAQALRAADRHAAWRALAIRQQSHIYKVMRRRAWIRRSIRIRAGGLAVPAGEGGPPSAHEPVKRWDARWVRWRRQLAGSPTLLGFLPGVRRRRWKPNSRCRRPPVTILLPGGGDRRAHNLKCAGEERPLSKFLNALRRERYRSSRGISVGEKCGFSGSVRRRLSS